MSTITLTASMRSNLAALQTIQNQMNTTQQRLSTGKKVNSAIDNASSYYQSRALSNRAADLDSLLDGMGQGIQTIRAAEEGIAAITKYVEQMKSVAESAAAVQKAADDDDGSKYAAAIKEYTDQFDAIKAEIDKVVADSAYQGVNLLKGGKLSITFNEGRTNTFEFTGKDVATGLGIAAAKVDGDDGWKDNDAIKTAMGTVAKAIDYLRSFSSELGNNFSIIETRQDFTRAMIDVLETGADSLVLADMNEESANYLALQTRQQLAVNSLALASQSAQSVLKLF